MPAAMTAGEDVLVAAATVRAGDVRVLRELAQVTASAAALVIAIVIVMVGHRKIVAPTLRRGEFLTKIETRCKKFARYFRR